MESHRQDSERSTNYQITFLHQLPPDESSLFGGKATNLARLHHYGFPIPKGFVVPTRAFLAFISTCKRNKSFNRIQSDQDNIEEIISSAESFRKTASKYEIPQIVSEEIIRGFNQLVTRQKEANTGYAVRSSATMEDTEHFSFAGQADSFLCVRDQTNVIEAVKRTWLSLYSPRALLYLQTKGIHVDQIHMGVIIQEMILGDVSGVMFTANVVTQNPNQLIIDSTWGLGESIVSGKVTPDSFIVQKVPLEIIEQRLGEKNLYSAPHPGNQPECTVFKETPKNKRKIYSLKVNKVRELAQLGIQIEQKMGLPQDIEWTYKDGKFVILQTRPITTL